MLRIAGSRGQAGGLLALRRQLLAALHQELLRLLVHGQCLGQRPVRCFETALELLGASVSRAGLNQGKQRSR